MEKERLPIIAIVGRPNVGKSSLFNRIAGSRAAIVEPVSGTTRDRLSASIRWKEKRFTLVDTAGFGDLKGTGAEGEMSALVLRQIRKGIEAADAILFVTDGRAGVLPPDRDLAAMLRKTGKKIHLVVNKIDAASDAGKAVDFYELGLGEPSAVSAMHGRGIEALCDSFAASVRHIPQAAEKKGVKVAIVGRPNVGKSSLVNALLREERVIVHPTAGTTRDAIDTDLLYKGRDYILIDTAGIRHNLKMSRAAEFYSSVRSKEAIDRSDVAVVLIDAYEGLTKDDARIIEHVLAAGKPLVLAVNKWDLLKGVEMARYHDSLVHEMRILQHVPVVFMSCKTGRKIDPCLDMAGRVYDRSQKVASLDEVSATLKRLNAAPEILNKRIKFRFLVQKSSCPALFVIGLTDTRVLDDSRKKYVENFLRRSFDLEGIPVQLRFENMFLKKAENSQ